MVRDAFAQALGLLAGELKAALGPQAVLADQPLARYTALRIGGPADLLVVATTAATLRQAVSLAWQHEVPCRVLGGGANVLVSDAGVRGLVVVNRAKGVSFSSPDPAALHRVMAESGASISTVARKCVTRGLAGLEWAASIPGTVGGAVVGNAGAWGGDVASSLVGAILLEPGGAVGYWPVERFAYAYRSSVLKAGLQSDQPQPIVLEAEFSLRPGDRESLETWVADMVAKRKASQPPGASCGSVFKNPSSDYAGRLIEAAGLKGSRVGGAEISQVHANFILNGGAATAKDVKGLIELARSTVHAQFGVTLDLEIQLIGEWQSTNSGGQVGSEALLCSPGHSDCSDLLHWE